MDSDFHVKPEIRILGIDDSALLNEKVMIVGPFLGGTDRWSPALRYQRLRLDATEVMVQ